MDELKRLRADIPVLEPSPVLLAQLVELSTAGAAAPAARRSSRRVRALLTSVAALGLVSTTSWIAGALPGVPSPLVRHEENPPAPTSPANPHRVPTDPRPSGADPTSGASRPHTRAPGVATTSAVSSGSVPTSSAAGGPATAGASPTGSAHSPGSDDDPGSRGHQGPGEDNGRHLGQQKHATRTPKPHPTPGPGKGDPGKGGDDGDKGDKGDKGTGSGTGGAGSGGNQVRSGGTSAPAAPDEGTSAGP